MIPEENWDQKISDVKEYHVDTFVMGDDWKGKFDFLKDYCEVVYLPRTEGISKVTRVRVIMVEQKVDIYVEVILKYGYNMINVMKEFKIKSQKEIEQLTAMNVGQIDVVGKGLQMD